MDTVWVLGDQLGPDNSALSRYPPGSARVLMIESDRQLSSRPIHRQRLHLIIAAMRNRARSLRDAGYQVDYRRAPSFGQGLADHRKEHRPQRLVVMEPSSWTLDSQLVNLDVTAVRSNAFLCHRDEFATWAEGRSSLVMEDFYRWQRCRLGYLMDGDQPSGGRWNYDKSNRRPPPKAHSWPTRPGARNGRIDRQVLASLPDSAFGSDPDGTWETTREGALERLDHFLREVLPWFGPYQDAMSSDSWSMSHALISAYLNIGLISPSEVCDGVEHEYRKGRVSIESAEGMIRQVIGWREYVWGTYWLHMPAYRDLNALKAQRPLPPLFVTGQTRMNCMATTLRTVDAHAYAHHIQRLMVLANFALITGIRPAEFVDWMSSTFIDAAEWVMLPNVLGMGLYADGGTMATKPYAAGGNYINKMSDYCRDCVYDASTRVGEQACPFTTLYWDFLLRNQDQLAGNPRVAVQLGAARRLTDAAEVQRRAEEVLGDMTAGDL